MNAVALSTYLQPFQVYFDMTDVNEICINRPGEIWVEKTGAFQKYDAPMFTESYLWQFARLVAEYNSREIASDTPTLSSTLPNGLRIQFVVPPACERGSFICSIRHKGVAQLPLKQYFNDSKKDLSSAQATVSSILLQAYRQNEYELFLKLAILHRKNIIISGGTSTGKTTFLNSLLHCIPPTERIITIETDREVICPHENAVHLLAAEEGKSIASTTMLDLLKASLRLRPDRILLSELRAEEAFPYLRAINSGHPGSITTLHADSPPGCFDQLAFMVMQGQRGNHLSRQELIAYAKSIIHIIVQIKRTPEGKRYISEMYFAEAEEEKR